MNKNNRTTFRISNLDRTNKSLEKALRSNASLSDNPNNDFVYEILDFVAMCDVIIQAGVLPSNPKKTLNKITIKRLRKYLERWSLEVNKIRSTSRLRATLYDFSRNFYANEEQEGKFSKSSNTKPTHYHWVTPQHNRKVGDFSRDYYQRKEA